MEITDWITLVAVLVALGIGVSSICQTRNNQKREHKHRLLNEIIEWALEVSNCRSSLVSILTDEESNELLSDMKYSFDLIDRYRDLESQGEYIKLIAFRLEDDLGNAVVQVLNNIKKREHLLRESIGQRPKLEPNELEKLLEILSGQTKTLDGLSEGAKRSLALGENAGELRKSTSKVIEEATKINTKDI